MRIDDDLMAALRETARRERTSLSRALNDALRSGLRAQRAPRKAGRRFRQKTLDLGAPRVDLDRALALAARLEDEATRAELALRK